MPLSIGSHTPDSPSRLSASEIRSTFFKNFSEKMAYVVFVHAPKKHTKGTQKHRKSFRENMAVGKYGNVASQRK